MTGPSLDRVLDRLDRVHGTGDDLVASCPVPGHGQGRGDRNPSLSVGWKDGKTLLNCQIGCHVQDILLALRMEWPDLFDEPLALGDKWGQKVAEWVYQKPDGSPYFTVERWQNAEGKRFVQRVPGHVYPPGHERAGKSKAGYPQGFRPCLYNLPAVLAEAQAGGTIYVVEGEKSVSAARALGLVATTGPNGAKAWQNYYCSWLKGAEQVYVIVDNDEDGRRYASEVVASIRGHGLACKALAVAVDEPKADLYDHVVRGYKVEDLRPQSLNRLRPTGVEFDQLLNTEYGQPRWAVPGLIASGLTLLGGPPKIGKSFITLDLAMGVACGGRALSGLECAQGSTLLLALDNDTERRIKERAEYLMGPVNPGPIPLEIHTEWPIGTEAIAACQEWVNETDDALMIVVDTLVRVEPNFEGDGRQNAYAASVEVLGRWARFAINNDVAVVMVHHDNKGEQEDWLNRFTGSRGITATAQTLLLLDVKRGQREGLLRVSGRDLETDDLEIYRTGRTWVVMDAPARPTPLRSVQ